MRGPQGSSRDRSQLEQEFTLKALGDSRFILGIEAEYNRLEGELKIKQQQFIHRLAEKFKLVDVSGVRNPNVLGRDFAPTSEHKPFSDQRAYRELIGSLLYVAGTTHPDISVGVSILSQNLEDPRDVH